MVKQDLLTARAAAKYLMSDSSLNREQIYKILYLANKKHLCTYGQNIIEDKFIATDDGPVPQYISENIESIENEENDEEYLDLSDCDIKTLYDACVNYRCIPIEELRVKSKDKAFNKTCKGDIIKFDTILKYLDTSEDILHYIKDLYETREMLHNISEMLRDLKN